MRSLWMWILIVMLPLQVADAKWEKNEMYMNLAIGIRHAVPKTTTQPPWKVKEIIKKLADKLKLELYYAGVAIVDDTDLLLALQDSGNEDGKDRMKRAADRIGKGSGGSLNDMTMLEVVREIREKVDWTAHTLNRDYMPKVVLVFWEVGENIQNKKQYLLDEAYKTVQDGGGFVFINHFRGRDPMEAMVVFPIFGQNKVQYQNLWRTASYDEVATAANKTLSDSVGLCWLNWERHPPCYWHPVLGCVENATNDIKYNNGTHDGQLWEDLEKWYCCKRATITFCDTRYRSCPPTTTTRTTTTGPSSSSISTKTSTKSTTTKSTSTKSTSTKSTSTKSTTTKSTTTKSTSTKATTSKSTSTKSTSTKSTTTPTTTTTTPTTTTTTKRTTTPTTRTSRPTTTTSTRTTRKTTSKSTSTKRKESSSSSAIKSTTKASTTISTTGSTSTRTSAGTRKSILTSTSTTSTKTTLVYGVSSTESTDGEAVKNPDETDSSTTGILIGLGVTCVIVVVAVIALVFFLVRRRKKSEKKSVKMAEKKSKLVSRKSVMFVSNRSDSPPAWSFSRPPELSITPADELIKQYLKKK